MLEAKFLTNLKTHYPAAKAQAIYDLCADASKLEAMPVAEFMEMLV